MNIEKMRAKFEAWAITSAYLGLGSKEDLLFDNADENGYDHPEVHLAWLGWQASRAAIEVELPSPIYWGSSESMEGYDAEEMKSAIQSLGMKTKVKP